MKKLAFIGVLAMLFAIGCSKEDPSMHPAAEEDRTVGVTFRMETPFDTDTTVEPMSRATTYVNWLSNRCRALILKKIDGRWIVEQTQTVLLDAKASPWTELKLSGDLQPSSFGFELRPGDYRIVVVTNPSSLAWNAELTPGTVVADERDGSLIPPPFATYPISTHWMNNGLRMLNREIYVAVADFTVPKSDELHASGMPPVSLHAERRVGKIRLLLKDKPSPVKGFTFDQTAHKFMIVLTALDKPFAEGIDALGGMYYSPEKLYRLQWCMSTMDFHTSGGARYQMTQTNSTVFSPFLLIDPEAGEQPFEISEIIIAGASGGFVYITDQVFTRTLAASKICGIVFQTTDISEQNVSPYMVHVEEATDDAGDKENAVTLFDPYFEWNAENE